MTPSSGTDFDPESAVSVGRVVAPHALRGEIKVDPLTDFPERFQRGSRLWLKGQPRRVASSRWQGKLVYVKLDGIDTRTAAEPLRGEELQVPRAMRIEDEDRYYQHDIMGLRVEDTAGETLGKVESIFSTGANDVYVVKGERGELLLPAVEDVIKQIDIPNGRIVVEMVPGLEFTKAAAPGTPKPRHRRPPPKPRGTPGGGFEAP